MMMPMLRAGLAALPTLLLAACVILPEFTACPETALPAVRIVQAGRVLAPERADALLAPLRAGGKADLIGRHLAFVGAQTGAPLFAGNAVRLLVDGPDTHAAMLRAIQAAQDHINLEVFVFGDDAVGHRVADALLQKQRRGVQVNLLYDSLGSEKTPKTFFDRLAAGGISVVEFNPIDRGLVAYRHRDHRKILVVDGQIAVIGGINITAAYGTSSAAFRDGQDSPSLETGWRDTSLEIRGPAVAAVQQLFQDSWRRQGGPALATRRYFPELQPAGDTILRVIGSGPDGRRGAIYLTLLSAIAGAAESVYLTTAFFAPDRQLLDVLIAAAQRGVDVQLLAPGVTDHPIVQAAGRSHYAELLRAGVRIYEEHDVLLHAKTAVVDGIWSTVGSANLDAWSFVRNDEVNVAVLDKAFGRSMQQLFEADRAVATEILADAWARRPLGERLKEFYARLWKGLF